MELPVKLKGALYTEQAGKGGGYVLPLPIWLASYRHFRAPTHSPQLSPMKQAQQRQPFKLHKLHAPITRCHTLTTYHHHLPRKRTLSAIGQGVLLSLVIGKG